MQTLKLEIFYASYTFSCLKLNVQNFACHIPIESKTSVGKV